MAYAILIVAFVANAIANVLLKVGADKGVRLDWSLGLVGLLSHHLYLIGGLFLFVVNVGFYVAALRMLPLTIAYPVMVGMSFIIASTLAVVFLHESLTWVHIVGFALILFGVTLVVSHGA